MEFLLTSGQPAKQNNNCIVVGIFENRKLSGEAEQIDSLSDGTISRLIDRGDMNGKRGQTRILYSISDGFCDRLVVVGLGKEDDFNQQAYLSSVQAAYNAVAETGSSEATFYLPTLPVKNSNEAWKVKQAVITMLNCAYRYATTLSQSPAPTHLKQITLAIEDAQNLAQGEQAIAQGIAIGHGMQTARHVADLPGNICTPTYLATQAQELATTFAQLNCEVLEEADLEKLGMGSFLSVSRGSREPAKLIVMQYNGGKAGEAPIALVGKGLTFDAGGISLKPAAAMDEMKYDMCGGASVLGTMQALVELSLPINVVGIIAASENLPDGAANKPGDVVTSMSGQTIEILNTDAEGRLILCDALTYVGKFKPRLVVDIATLTGACVIALGKHATGMFSNDRGLASDLNKAASDSSDRVWELPLWDDYQPQLKSNFADMGNVGGRDAGSITAACFLSRFTKEYRWAHLDIAGTAWRSGALKGATGRPVPLLTQLLINDCEK